MPSEALATGQRLHPSSLLFSIGSIARRMVLPAVAALFLSGRGWEAALAIFAAPAIVGSVLRYLTYRWRVQGDELVIREGLLSRRERHVPFARIQNVDLTQNPLHRLFGVAEARIETAGGSSPEATIRVLGLDAIETLRAHVLAGRDEPAPDADGDPAPADAVDRRVLHRMDPADLTLFGVISNRGMVVVAALFGLGWQFDVWERLEALEGMPWPELDLAAHPVANAVRLVGLLAAALVLVRLLSIVLAWLTFHGFTLSLRGATLRTEAGLATRVTRTVPRRRIQVLVALDGPLHRLFDRVGVRVETAGGGGQEQDGATDRLWLAPLLRRDALASLLRETLPEVDLSDPDWRPISGRARWRLIRRSALFWMPAGVGLWLWIGAWSLLPTLALAALGVLNAQLTCRFTRWAEVDGGFCVRHGWWTRRLVVARHGKIQGVALSQSPFDRRARMATLRVDTAGAGRIGPGLAVELLDAPVAAGLLDRLSSAAGRTTFRW